MQKKHNWRKVFSWLIREITPGLRVRVIQPIHNRHFTMTIVEGVTGTVIAILDAHELVKVQLDFWKVHILVDEDTFFDFFEVIDNDEGGEQSFSWQIQPEPYHHTDTDKKGYTRYYNENNELHRIDGPAVEGPDGYKAWYINGIIHNTEGPAVDQADGYKAWYINDKLHRLDGPAVEDANGDKYWYRNGKLHRKNGPAVEYVNGDKVWYINDEFIGRSTEGFTDADFENYKREHNITSSKKAWLRHIPPQNIVNSMYYLSTLPSNKILAYLCLIEDAIAAAIIDYFNEQGYEKEAKELLALIKLSKHIVNATMNHAGEHIVTLIDIQDYLENFLIDSGDFSMEELDIIQNIETIWSSLIVLLHTLSTDNEGRCLKVKANLTQETFIPSTVVTFPELEGVLSC